MRRLKKGKVEEKCLIKIVHSYLILEERKDYKHPTQKPVRLSMRAMAISTNHGDIVLDLFGGSGSTLMGAERAGRRAYIMELDPAYCDVIRNRYEQYTNKNKETQG